MNAKILHDSGDRVWLFTNYSTNGPVLGLHSMTWFSVYCVVCQVLFTFDEARLLQHFAVTYWLNNGTQMEDDEATEADRQVPGTKEQLHFIAQVCDRNVWRQMMG